MRKSSCWRDGSSAARGAPTVIAALARHREEA
jgi:hypothetical protein